MTCRARAMRLGTSRSVMARHDDVPSVPGLLAKRNLHRRRGDRFVAQQTPRDDRLPIAVWMRRRERWTQS